MFSVTDIGVNEEKTRIEKLYFDKNFYYNDDVIFIITITNNSDGTLEDVALRDGYGDEFVIGGNSISIGLDLPIDFDPEAYTIKAFVWTGL